MTSYETIYNDILYLAQCLPSLELDEHDIDICFSHSSASYSMPSVKNTWLQKNNLEEEEAK